MGWTADPGRREGLLPSLALGYHLTPLQGSQDEAAASLPLHFLKNVQCSGQPLYAWLARSVDLQPARFRELQGPNSTPICFIGILCLCG